MSILKSFCKVGGRFVICSKQTSFGSIKTLGSMSNMGFRCSWFDLLCADFFID